MSYVAASIQCAALAICLGLSCLLYWLVRLTHAVEGIYEVERRR